ncbi:hypothetical protein [Prevotella sp.]|uniref:hypothetical protein n=1 Tax=Prevotella sp. TaxID=59823 RepID=UPI002ABE78E7|nr:hypothetical protein [Prevotella sp.]
MLIIEILQIIASLSITMALFYAFFRVGRQSAYDHILERFSDAVNILDKQNAYIQSLEERERHDPKRPMLIEYEPSVHAEDFIDSLQRMIAKYGNKTVELESADITDVIYDAERGFFTPTCLCDIPLKASEMVSMIRFLMSKHGNLAVECPKLMLSSITYYADTNKFHIS